MIIACIQATFHPNVIYRHHICAQIFLLTTKTAATSGLVLNFFNHYPVTAQNTISGKLEYLLLLKVDVCQHL